MRKYDAIKVDEWRRKVEACLKSHFPIAVWCRVNRVSYDQLFYWRKKLNLSVDRSIRSAVFAIFPQASKIILYAKPVNLHMSFDNLRFLIHQSMFQVEQGSYYVFLSMRKHSIKVFSVDSSSSEIIAYKRLNRGIILYKREIESAEKRGEFCILLE
jgi:hypothetical protein